MILSVTAAIVAAQLGTGMDVIEPRPSAEPVQYQRPVRCGHGYDLDIRDGRCYPNGMVPHRFQQGYGYRYQGDGHPGYIGRHPVRCGHGADLDIRDGRCYPNGTVPHRFQDNRRRYY